LSKPLRASAISVVNVSTLNSIGARLEERFRL
jgi:hypothetical protein